MSSIDDHRVWREVREALIRLEERSRDPDLQMALAVALAAKGEAVAAQLVRHMIAIVHGMPRAQAHVPGERPTSAAKLPPLHGYADLISLLDVTEPTHSSPPGPTHFRNEDAKRETELTIGGLAPSVQQLFHALSLAVGTPTAAIEDALSALAEAIEGSWRQPDRTAYLARTAWIVQQQLKIWLDDAWSWAEPPVGSAALLAAVANASDTGLGAYCRTIRDVAKDASDLLSLASLWSEGEPDELVALEKACVLLAQNIAPGLLSDFVEELGTFGLLRAVATLDAVEEARHRVTDAIFLFRVRDAHLDGGQPEQALAVQQRICDRWPDNADEFVVLGEIALAAGRFGRAEQSYQQVLAMLPGHDRATSRLKELASGQSPVVRSEAFGTPPEVRERRAFMRDPVQRQSALDHLLHKADGLVDASASPTRKIILSSDHHWYDMAYYASLGKAGGVMGRKKRPVRTIALYYWRLHDGGTERVTSRLAHMWRALGYRVLLLTDEKPSIVDYDCGPGVERFQLPSHRSRYVDRGTALAKVLRTQAVDVFVSNLWIETATSWDLFVAKSMDIPVIIGWHNVFDAGIYDGYDIGFFQQRLVAYRYADLVVALSTMDQYWFSVQGIKSRVIHNPLTFTSMPERVSPLTSRQIVWMGRTETHQKRIDHVIRMFPIVLQKVPNATLVIVGDGPNRSDAEHLAQSLGIARSVHFVGYSSTVEDYLDEAAVHVMTSEFEGSPMVISEAWAHGVPTVMYDLPFLEFLRSGKGFLSVEQLDYEALGQEVARVLTDNALRARLGKEARASAQAFFDIDVGGEWKAVFDGLADEDDMSVPIAPRDVVAVAPVLARHLADRMYAVDARASQDLRKVQAQQPAPAPAPALSGTPFRARHLLKPDARRKAVSRALHSLSETTAKTVVRYGIEALSRRPKIVFRKLKTIDLAHIGLGDNLMAWVGLHALLSNGMFVVAPECRLYVPTDLTALATTLFSRYGIHVIGVAPHTRVEQISPVFSPLPPESPAEWYGTFVGADWRMNCFEALDGQKTIPRANARSDDTSRFRLGLSERILYRRDGWRSAGADYIGYRLWLPIAREMGLAPLNYLTLVKRALRSLRLEVAAYVDARFEGAEPGPDIALFPAGKSFQAFSPGSSRSLREQLPAKAVFYVQENDPWIAEYRDAGIDPRNLSTVDELFWIIRSSRRVMTTDSFSSHVAQLLRDDFVLALSRDFKENIVHPGAHPSIVANHPGCAPCNYAPRNETSTCVAGYKNCIAFENPEFIKEIAAALLAYPAPSKTPQPVHSIA